MFVFVMQNNKYLAKNSVINFTGFFVRSNCISLLFSLGLSVIVVYPFIVLLFGKLLFEHSI